MYLVTTSRSLCTKGRRAEGGSETQRYVEPEFLRENKEEVLSIWGHESKHQQGRAFPIPNFIGSERKDKVGIGRVAEFLSSRTSEELLNTLYKP